jgi:hypothetical protein
MARARQRNGNSQRRIISSARYTGRSEHRDRAENGRDTPDAPNESRQPGGCLLALAGSCDRDHDQFWT